MRNILVITHFLPWPVRQASWHRNMSLLEHLHDERHRVDLLVVPQRPWSRSSIESFPPVVDRLVVCPPGGGESPANWFVGHAANLIRATGLAPLESAGRRAIHLVRRLRKRLRRPAQRTDAKAASSKIQHVGPGFSFTESQRAALRELLADGDYDTILLGNTIITPVLDGIPQDDRLWLVDTNDCFHQRAASMRRRGMEVDPVVDYSREQETDALARFDAVIAIQNEEAGTFREMLPGKNVICVGMTGALESLPPRRGHVTLVGAPSDVNAEGVIRVLRDVWPHVARKHPEALLDVYGGVCDWDGVRDAAEPLGKSVVLHGVVEDLKRAYHCDVVLAPLWVGSGLKLKVVEGLCHGKPVVTTSIGAQGLAEAVGSSLLVADEPTEMADHLSRLLSDETHRHSTAEAAFAFATRRFGPRQVYAELDQLLAASPVGRTPPITSKASRPCADRPHFGEGNGHVNTRATAQENDCPTSSTSAIAR